MNRGFGAIALCILALSGCNQEQVNSLQKQLEVANKKVEEGETKIAALEASWKKFEQGFDAEKRTQLNQSIEAVEGMIQRVEKDAQGATSVLQSVQDLEVEVKKLRDLCAKHESESSDANLVGQVKNSVAALEARVQSLNSVRNDLSMLRSKIQSLESKVSMIQMKVR